MTDLTPNASWDPVTQLEITDRVLAGPGGRANLQAQQLLNRTAHLDVRLGQLGTLSAQHADAVTLAGGTIDGVTIGGAVPAAGHFTDLSAGGFPVWHQGNDTPWARREEMRLPERFPPTLAITAEPGRPLAGVEVTAVGTRWSVGPDGRLQATPPGALRDDYDPLTGTYRGKLIEAESRTNHLTYSARFEGWTAVAAGATDFAAAGPDGARSAAAIVETTASGVHYVEQVPGLPDDSLCAVSVFAAGAGRNLYVWLTDSGWPGQAGVVFDLAAGTVVSVGTGVETARITAHRDGWWRCEVVARTTAAPGPRRVRLALHNGSTSSYAGDGAGGVLLWQAQAEVGVFATSPIPTGATTATRVAEDVRVPIHGYAGGPAGPPGTNLITAGAWTATAVTVDGDVAEAPLGLGPTADRLTDTAAVGEHGIDTDVTVAGGDAVAFAAFVRFDTVARVRLRLGDTAGTDGMTADFTAAGLAATSEGGAALLHGTLFRRYPGGWFRVGLRGVIDPDSTTARCAIRLHDGSGVDYAGGTGTLYTAATQATVGADFTPFDAVDAGHWYVPAEGTLLVEGTPLRLGGTQAMAAMHNGSADHGLVIGQSGQGSVYRSLALVDGLQQGVAAASGGPVAGRGSALALAYAADGLTICVDGEPPVTAPVGSLPDDISALSIGRRGTDSGTAWHGAIRRIEYRGRRLPASALVPLAIRHAGG